MSRSDYSPRIVIILICAMLCWGSAYPLSKYLMGNIHPAIMAFLRHSTGLLPLIPFFLKERKKLARPIPFRDIAGMSGIGVFGIAGFALLLFYGVNLSSAATGSTLVNTQPIFAVILSPLLLKEKVTPWEIFGTLAGLFGMILVTTGGEFSILKTGDRCLYGNLLLLGAAVLMTLYNISLKSYIQSYGGMIPTFFTMLSGSLVLLFTSFLIQGPDALHLQITNFGDILLIIYIGFFATALPFFLFNFALKSVDVIRAAGFKFLIPVSGVTLSILLIGENPGIPTLTGILIVIISVIILQRKPKQKTIL